MKTIPGFRTSQPGSATEGETFLMRGLEGNDYTKILINGIPIKPEAVKSMPIAAQLPIRHAEYIEIVQGPCALPRPLKCEITFTRSINRFLLLNQVGTYG